MDLLYRLFVYCLTSRIQDLGDSMKISFADGVTSMANLVIGADGIHSNVRSHYIVSAVLQQVMSPRTQSSSRATMLNSATWLCIAVSVQCRTFGPGGRTRPSRCPGWRPASMSWCTRSAAITF